MTTRRRLIFIRHAHSPYSLDFDGDHERPISDRGREDAERVARHLVELGWVPEKVLSSDAVRARETWQVMEPVFDDHASAIDPRYTRGLYGAEVERICDDIWALASDLTDIALVGHNPGWENVVEWLVQLRVDMPPGSAALLEGSGESWPEATQQNAWNFVELVRPSALRVEED
jgi:phosphohistidine phosphatase SixA